MGLNRQSGNKYNYKLPSLDKMKGLYFNNNMSTNDIALKYDVTKGAVRLKFIRNGIKLRTMSQGQELKSNKLIINNKIIEFIEGLILGDGCLRYTAERKSCCYSHSDKNKTYLVFLIKRFNQLGIKSSKIYKCARGYFHFSTKFYRSLVFLKKTWYPKGKKVIPNKFMLTPLKLKYWYIGDGSYDKKSSSEKIIICCDEKVQNRNRLYNELNRLGIKCSTYSSGFYIKKVSRKTFFDLMLSDGTGIVDCYKYKFPEGVQWH